MRKSMKDRKKVRKKEKKKASKQEMNFEGQFTESTQGFVSVNAQLNYIYVNLIIYLQILSFVELSQSHKG